MHIRLRAAALTFLPALLTAGTAAAFVLDPANGFLGYTYNKWGDPAVGTGTVTTADFGLLRARLGTLPGPSGLAP